MNALGTLDKMPTLRINPVQYFLQLGDQQIAMNELIGKNISLRFTGNIYCGICNKKTYKSFGEGLCYNCFMNAAENAECILKPELCQAHEGKGLSLIHILPFPWLELTYSYTHRIAVYRWY